jgi:hypothetical protein
MTTPRRASPDVAELRKLFVYDSELGGLRWRAGLKGRGGRPAGTVTERGYVRVRIGAGFLYAHSIVVALHTGAWPDEVDHANGDRADNRVENLRVCTHQQNMWNRKRSDKEFTSRFKGVYWSTQKGKWQARIGVDNRVVHLGFFSDEDAAGQAYAEGAKTHAREFARAC